jgi:ubiquinone/menaquinone biosynthesis C-methylase UbiE
VKEELLKKFWRFFSSSSLILLSLIAQPSLSQVPQQAVELSHPKYDKITAHEGGTGKVYLGRQIAEVMDDSAAEWLNRPAREREERTDLVLNLLELGVNAVVADVGAGSGYYSFRIAKKIPQGRVLALDVQQEMLDLLIKESARQNVKNVTPVLGQIDDTRLAENSVDLVLLVDAYHEFSHPWEMMTSIVKALKKNGRVVLLEYRGEDSKVPIKKLHKMTQVQVKREMAAVGLKWEKTVNELPWQHFLVFRR